jgi:hypothetical protein
LLQNGPLALAQQAQQAQSYPSPLGILPDSNMVTLNLRAAEMLRKRIGGLRAELRVPDGDFLACHVVNDVVHVFFCHNCNSGVTQEPLDLFPSDTLVAQFRMIFS